MIELNDEAIKKLSRKIAFPTLVAMLCSKEASIEKRIRLCAEQIECVEEERRALAAFENKLFELRKELNQHAEEHSSDSS